MAKRLLNRSMLVNVVLMLIVVLCLSSCEAWRKKFIRHKKEGANPASEAQPILEPQEYPALENNAPELYKQHYALIKVWYKDLWTGIEERNTDSSVRYGIKQINEHLEEMKKLLKPEKVADLNKLSDLLKFYQTSLDQPRMVRNYARIQSDLRAFDRLLRKEFRQDAVKEDLLLK